MGTAQNLNNGDQLFKNLTLMIKQAHHDYASPVMSINSIVKFSKNLNADERNLLKRSVERINGIINGLKKQTATSKSIRKQNTVNLSEAIEHIITEKSAAIKAMEFIEVKYDFSKSFKKIDFDFDQIDLNRILSNLIQNSIEAIELKGQITITGQTKGSKLLISITDNGKGIPAHIQSQIGRMGLSYGKENGSGLGLSSAIEALKAHKGKLNIKSRVGWGTRVVVEVPFK